MKRSGYTLAEVLAAVAVVAIVVSGVVGLFHTAGSAQRMAVNKVKAALLARTVLDEIRLQARMGKVPSDIPEGTHPFFRNFHFQLSVVPLDPFEREFLLLLAVRWYPPERPPPTPKDAPPPQITFSTIVCVTR